MLVLILPLIYGAEYLVFNVNYPLRRQPFGLYVLIIPELTTVN